MPRIESSKRRYARRASQRFQAWLTQKNRKARQTIEVENAEWIDGDGWNDSEAWYDGGNPTQIPLYADKYVTIPTWTATTQEILIKGRARFVASEMGSSVNLLGDDSLTSVSISKVTSDKFQVAYKNEAGAQVYFSFDTVPVLVDTNYEFVLQQGATGSLILGMNDLDGNVISTRTAPSRMDTSKLNVKYLGSNHVGSKFLDGSLWEVELQDPASLSNSRRYKLNESIGIAAIDIASGQNGIWSAEPTRIAFTE